MIRLHFDIPDDDAWKDWVEECKEALNEIPDGADKPKIDSELYKEMRGRFLDATHKKCAYCELRLSPGQRKGDVEHYRPKGAVRDRHGKIVKVVIDGVERDHPGYYWLAYKWENLLPSCSACNRRAGDEASGEQTGKGEIFPTLNSWWATKPEEVENEQPALLNPWFDDPREHLVVDPETGVVGNLTERGRITIDILGLNRDGLPEARREAIRTTTDLYADYIRERGQSIHHPGHIEAIGEINGGSATYLSSRLTAIKRVWARVVGEGIPVPPPGITCLDE